MWWRQAKSDFEVFEILRRSGAMPCHYLHYLQMATEKIAKAYLWRTRRPPDKSHVGFVLFLRLLGGIRPEHRDRVAQRLSFRRWDDLQTWIRTSGMTFARDLELLTPARAGDGPNLEYPWPHKAPHTAPVDYKSPLWNALHDGRARQLLKVMRIAMDRFPEYVDI